MKTTSTCIICLMERAGYSCDLCCAGIPEKRAELLKAQALRKVLDFFSKNLEKDPIPAVLGTWRERIIAETTGVPDCYVGIKARSNAAGKRLLNAARKWISKKKKEGKDELTLALCISASGNNVEFGVHGHDFDLKSFEKNFLSMLDEALNPKNRIKTREIMDALKRHERVLFLTDNAGEIFLDLPLIEYLINSGKTVTICPKTGPILNDATVSDIKKLNLPENVKVLPSGSFVGVFPEEADPAFLSEFWNPRNLIIAKGMGNYETLSDMDSDKRLDGRVIYVFRAKCTPVARHAGVSEKSFVAIVAE